MDGFGILDTILYDSGPVKCYITFCVYNKAS